MSPRPVPMITPEQIRGARAMLGWSREDLAKRSGVSAPTVRDFEVKGSDPKQGTVQKWRRALEQAGFRLVAAGLTYCVEHPDDAAAEGYPLEEVQRMFMKLA